MDYRTSLEADSTIGVIGLATIDHLYVVSSYPAADTENRVADYLMVVGGPAGRGAIAAARLGGRVKLLATRGNDMNGDALASLIDAESIEASWIVSQQPSQQSAVVVGVREASRTIFWLPQPFADDQALTQLPDFLSDVDVVLLDSTDEKLTKAALDICEARGIETVIDSGSGRPWTGDLLPRVDHVICPEKYVVKAHGSADEVTIKAAAKRNCRQVFGVTAGGQGGRFVTLGREDIRQWDPAPVQAVDTCGAGDTFHGAYAWAIGHGLTPPESFELAAWSAALKIARMGNVGIPTLAEIDTARGRQAPRAKAP